jgi:predicted O-methyltransferase YrrM
MPTFTRDWFSHNAPVLEQALTHVKARRQFLEVGCFEGMSTCWFLQNALDEVGEITCIDTFEGGIEHTVTSFEGVRERFEENVAEMKRAAQTVTLLPMPSTQALAQLIVQGRQFDFAYIDGSHVAADVLADACMAFSLLKPGAVMAFDDYLYGADKPVLETPKPAIDAFTLLYRERIKVLRMGYLAVVQRVG